jgi:hypothetical protein
MDPCTIQALLAEAKAYSNTTAVDRLIKAVEILAENQCYGIMLLQQNNIISAKDSDAMLKKLVPA